jgi:homoserine kinase type II
VAVKTELSRAELEQAAREWGLGPLQTVLGMPEGSINTLYRLETADGWYVLRLSEVQNDAGVDYETRLLSFLDANRYPAVKLVPRPDGRLFAQVGGRPACVFAWAAGDEVRAWALTPEQAQESGRLLARLHLLTEAFDGRQPSRYDTAFVRGAVASLSHEAVRPGRSNDSELWDALPLLEAEAGELERLPAAPEGTIHADWFPDNLRFAGNRISCVLDWEMACRGPFVLDLATALHAGCYDNGYVQARAASLVAGYQSLRPLSPAEKRAFHAWARFSALRFTVTRVSDYHRSPLATDTLRRKDWRRFRDRLQRTAELGPDGWAKLLGL